MMIKSIIAENERKNFEDSVGGRPNGDSTEIEQKHERTLLVLGKIPCRRTKIQRPVFYYYEVLARVADNRISLGRTYQCLRTSPEILEF